LESAKTNFEVFVRNDGSFEFISLGLLATRAAIFWFDKLIAPLEGRPLKRKVSFSYRKKLSLLL
jgi:hypothetical protein